MTNHERPDLAREEGRVGSPGQGTPFPILLDQTTPSQGIPSYPRKHQNRMHPTPGRTRIGHTRVKTIPEQLIFNETTWFP